ncbi:MAG: TIGR00269 family protein, partial [Candidatus Bathyarchaeota archaeon]|nr:TIGR00269 family protein [Candidatus Bathyarchaeota archaeon]
MTQPCTRCRANPSIYHRPYSGERLCRLCFTVTIKEKVRHTIARHDMLEYDSRITLGLSGGKDSIALLE